MIVPLNIHGLFGDGLSPIDWSIFVILSNQCRGVQRRPYNARLSNQYEPAGVRGQPAGGLTTYVSLCGSVDCMNACLTLPDLSFRFDLTERAAMNRISICDMTGV